MPNVNTIAIDIAIIPPIEVMEKIININKQAATNNLAWMPLGKNDFLPHMSLAMGGVVYDNLKIVHNIVQDVAKKFNPISVELNELYFAEQPDGSKVYGLRAKKSAALQRLHESLMSELRGYFSTDCTKETLFSKPGEIVTEPQYINTFAALFSFKAFDPHITIQTKDRIGEELLPLKFIATKIAMCHVGVMTTCRKELFAVELSS